MAVTKKLFNAVASVLAEQNRHIERTAANGPHQSPEEVVREIAEGLAHEFAWMNPRFSRDRFLAACGIKDGR